MSTNLMTASLAAKMTVSVVLPGTTKAVSAIIYKIEDRVVTLKYGRANRLSFHTPKSIDSGKVAVMARKAA